MAKFTATITRTYEGHYDDADLELRDGQTLESLSPAELFDARAEMVYAWVENDDFQDGDMDIKEDQ